MVLLVVCSARDNWAPNFPQSLHSASLRALTTPMSMLWNAPSRSRMRRTSCSASAPVSELLAQFTGPPTSTTPTAMWRSSIHRRSIRRRSTTTSSTAGSRRRTSPTAQSGRTSTTRPTMSSRLRTPSATSGRSSTTHACWRHPSVSLATGRRTRTTGSTR